jgi:hypothetical protein
VGGVIVTPTILSRAEAAEYVWENSPKIRMWYKRELKFNLDDYTRSEYNTSGLDAPGDVIDSIISDGISDRVISEDGNGGYLVVIRHVLKAVKYDGDTMDGQRIWVLQDAETGELVGGQCPDYARTRAQMYRDCESMFPGNSTWHGHRVHGGYSIEVAP